MSNEWLKDGAAGTPIMEDILKMVEALKRDKAFAPFMMYLPDACIISQGGDPNDYPELEGYPGVRVVEAK